MVFCDGQMQVTFRLPTVNNQSVFSEPRGQSVQRFNLAAITQITLHNIMSTHIHTGEIVKEVLFSL